jgi:purine-nucleoside phosphorylase
MTKWDEVEKAANFICQQLGGRKPSVLLVLGPGLGDFAKCLKNAAHIPYADIPRFQPPKVQGHGGTLHFGDVGSTNVMVLEGRSRLHEGIDPNDNVLRLRACLLAMPGQITGKTVILTAATWAINRMLKVDDLMVVDGQKIMRNDDLCGSRFLTMSGAYDKDLQAHVLKCAQDFDLGPQVRGPGIHLGTPRLYYGSEAEVQEMRRAGADTAGMSIIHEAVAAHHEGARLLGVVLVTNMAGGPDFSQEHVVVVSKKAEKAFGDLMAHVIATLPSSKKY